MPDKVKPLKIENPASGGTDTDTGPTETNPNQDYLATKGIAFENADNRLIDLTPTTKEIQFLDAVETVAITVRMLRTAVQNIFSNATNLFSATNVQAAIEEAKFKRHKKIAKATAEDTTTSSTWRLLVGMEVTIDLAGSYELFFNGDCDTDGVNGKGEWQFYKNGSPIAGTKRTLGVSTLILGLITLSSCEVAAPVTILEDDVAAVVGDKFQVYFRSTNGQTIRTQGRVLRAVRTT